MATILNLVRMMMIMMMMVIIMVVEVIMMVVMMMLMAAATIGIRMTIKMKNKRKQDKNNQEK